MIDASCVPPIAASPDAAAQAGSSVFGFLTGSGQYMPRMHCMVNEAGSPDWGWIAALAGLNIIVILGYVRIFRFWRKAYLEPEPEDRNDKMMDLAWIFLWCAVCGYVASVVMFFWPAYRLVVFCLVPLAFFTWRFALNAEPFRVALQAKRLERELRESLELRNHELERVVAERTAELETARRAADAANEAKSRFLTNMSHEIRTPLNAIVGYVELLEEDRSDEQRHREHVQTIFRSGEHLLAIVNDVLDLAKIESGKLAVECIATKPGCILEDTMSIFKGRAIEAGITLAMHVEPSVPRTVKTDPTRLRQIVANLVSNAIKFTPEGSVTINADHNNGHLIITVTDTGIGMDQGTIARIFNAFEQEDAATTRRFGGTGLGLRISQDLANLLGGGIVVESTPGQGTTFRLTVHAPAAPDSDDGSPTQSPRYARPIEGKTLLLVEDGEDNARLATIFLERAGATVVHAANGKEAIDVVGERDHFDLILMDIQMPILDGEQATLQLRERGCDIPIIALTANAMDEAVSKYNAIGFDGHIMKPYRREDLVTATERAIKRGRYRRNAA